MNPQKAAFSRAFDIETAPSVGLAATDAREQAATEANATASTGAIADRLMETTPSVNESTGMSNGRGLANDDDNDGKKGPGDTSL